MVDRPDSNPATTIQLRRAIEGDERSLAWIISRFTPLLRTQARYRLSRSLDGIHEPDDLVQDVWAVAIPRLATLEEHGGRYTPSLVSFLGSVLARRYSELLRKHIRHERDRETTEGERFFDRLPARVRDLVARASESEVARIIAEGLRELSDADRDVLVLRGIEQQEPVQVAEALGITRHHVAVRYHRAKQRLKNRMPPQLFDDLELLESEDG